MSSTKKLVDKGVSKKKRKNENNDKSKQKIVKKPKIEEIEVDPLEITDRDKKIFPVVQLGARCECRHKCCDDLSDEDLQSVTQNVQNLSSKDEQDIYLQTMMEVLPVKNTDRRTTDDAKHQKNKSFRYFIDINGEKKVVCKMAFLNLHGIGFKRCRRISSFLKRPNEKPTKVKQAKSTVSRSNANSANKIFVVLHPFSERSRKKQKSKKSGK